MNCPRCEEKSALQEYRETITWRTVGGFRVAIVGMAVAGRNLQALVADELHIIRAVSFPKEGGEVVWMGLMPSNPDDQKAIEGYLRKEVDRP